jgi:hypothetical protein
MYVVSFENRIFSFTLKKTFYVAYYNAGVVVVYSEVVGLAPGVKCLHIVLITHQIVRI